MYLPQGEPMRKKKWAKMAVALKACEILHKAGKYNANSVMLLHV